MTFKRRTTAIAGLMLLIAVFAYRTAPERAEPCYEGRRLSEWLADCRPPEGPWDRGSGAERAVRAIGTNALPMLVEWTGYELPLWREALLWLATSRVPGKSLDEGKVVYGTSLIIPEAARRAERAELGFVLLNTNAAPVIPDLTALMKRSRSPTVRLRAIYALGEVGGPAIPALTNALADVNQPNRIEIIYALYGAERASPYYYGKTYRGAALPALTRALTDMDPEVSREASITLYNLDPELLARASAK